MGRRDVTHMQTGETVEAYGKQEPVLLCGEASSFLRRTTDDPARVTCPACSKIMALKALAERPADAPALTLEKHEGQTYYRFAYRAMMGGEHVGYVGYEGAYGKGQWLVSMITTENADDEGIKLGYQVEDERTLSTGETYQRKLTYASKEAALLDVPRLVEKGLLKSAAATIADAKEWSAKLARNAERRVQNQAEERQLRQDTRAGLQEIMTRVDRTEIVLTNFQRQALANAILRYGAPKRD